MEDGQGRPAPRQALGHPAVGPVREQSQDVAPGYDESDAVIQRAGGEGAADLAVPPPITGDVPRLSLAELAQQKSTEG